MGARLGVKGVGNGVMAGGIVVEECRGMKGVLLVRMATPSNGV